MESWVLDFAEEIAVCSPDTLTEHPHFSKASHVFLLKLVICDGCLDQRGALNKCVFNSDFYRVYFVKKNVLLEVEENHFSYAKMWSLSSSTIIEYVVIFERNQGINRSSAGKDSGQCNWYQQKVKPNGNCRRGCGKAILEIWPRRSCQLWFIKCSSCSDCW